MAEHIYRFIAFLDNFWFGLACGVAFYSQVLWAATWCIKKANSIEAERDELLEKHNGGE